MDRNELAERDWLFSLCSIEGVGRRTIFALYQKIGSFSGWPSLPKDLILSLHLPLSVRIQLVERMNEAQVLRDKAERIAKNVEFVCFLDDNFPTSLCHIPDPPAILFYKGDFSLLKEPLIAIVGTRKATSYGESACQYFASGLSKMGMVVVSGLALGIDTLAHRFALEAGSPSVAVLGCGIDQVYPRQNIRLYQQIEKHGLILSEYPPRTKLHPGLFPERNRIISGISHGVLVIEAAERSGSLITADHALEQGREVFAVPGPIFSPKSIGSNHLIKQGAKMVTECKEIVEEFPWFTPKIIENKFFDKVSLDSDERFLLSMIRETPVHWDELFMTLDPKRRAILDQTLVRLQTKNCVEWLPGGYYRRRADQK